MQRLLVRFALVSLCAGPVSACGMFGADDNVAVMPGGGQNVAVPTDVSAAVRQAQLLRAKGDLDGATRILSQLMLTAPDDAGVVGEYGKLLVQETRSDDAVQFLRRAIQLQPNDWSLYSAMGVAYDQQGNQPQAKIAYERALILKPGEPAILNNFAMSRMLAGDTVAARALMLQAKASGSTDPKIARNLALLDSMAPAKPATAQTQAALSAPVPVMITPSVLPTAVASQPIAPVMVAAHHAPAPITHNGNQVVMQEVPVDVLAGPTRVPHAPKPAKIAKVRHTPPQVAAAPAKPAKTAKATAADHIPALRMTADASKP
jgi:Flp pilus assembly protein TadD